MGTSRVCRARPAFTPTRSGRRASLGSVLLATRHFFSPPAQKARTLQQELEVRHPRSHSEVKAAPPAALIETSTAQREVPT